jgi:hypothetical protein
VGKHALRQAPLHHQAWLPLVEHVAGSTHMHARCAPSLFLSRIGPVHARCDPSLVSLALGHVCCALSRIGVCALCSLSRMQLARQEDVWDAARGGGVGRNSTRRRCVFSKNEAIGDAGRIGCSSICGRPHAGPSERPGTSIAQE